VLECSTPYINRRVHAREIAALDGVRLVEQANFERQLRSIAEEQPDLVISNIITANPLIGRGVVAKWGTEFMFAPIHGWAGVGALAGLFTRALRRHGKLDPLGMDPVWTAGVMPSSEVIPLARG
jgi:light-independent protochlorophyllide reductase subunit N